MEEKSIKADKGKLNQLNLRDKDIDLITLAYLIELAKLDYKINGLRVTNTIMAPLTNEAALKQKRALEESEYAQKLILNNIEKIVVDLALDKAILEFNEELELKGKTPQEIANKFSEKAQEVMEYIFNNIKIKSEEQK